ncbi:MAG: DUF4931 domain-containing protein [bacterium]
MIKTNFLTGEQVIFATSREKRGQNNNNNLNNNIIIDNTINCPFCMKNVHMLTEPVYTSFNNEIRVIYNKYPIAKHNPLGEHFVVIDALEHNNNIISYSKEHLYYLVKCVQDMILLLSKNSLLKSVQVFKNHGFKAGATQEHSHWQILALGVETSKEIKIKNAFSEYYNKNNSCYLCDIIKNKINIITQNDYFIAFCMEDYLFPNTITIAPISHVTSFNYLNDNILEELGLILQDCIKRLSLLISNLNYNICLYTSLEEKTGYHFFIEIIPRVGNFAGFEFLAGMYVNSVLPKDSAKALREIII